MSTESQTTHAALTPAAYEHKGYHAVTVAPRETLRQRVQRLASAPWRHMVEQPLIAWLTYWHGRGEPWQCEYYRCHGCKRIVTHKAIKGGGCTCGISNRVSPAALGRVEMLRLMLLPWACVIQGMRERAPLREERAND